MIFLLVVLLELVGASESGLTILLINLVRRHGKLQICDYQLKELKVSRYTHIAGVDGKLLFEELEGDSIKTVAQVLQNDFLLADRKFIDQTNIMNVGCTLSHLKAYQYILDQVIDGPVLILEDDFAADGEAIKKTLEIIDLLPKDWGLFYAGHCHSFRPANQFIHNGYQVALLNNEEVPCTHAYVVNGAAAAKKLFEAGNTAELYLADLFAQKSQLKRFIIYPYLFSQLKEIESDINSLGGNWHELRNDTLRQKVLQTFLLNKV